MSSVSLLIYDGEYPTIKGLNTLIARPVLSNAIKTLDIGHNCNYNFWQCDYKN
jgi:hypothetical protein